jgi:transposase-like protein
MSKSRRRHSKPSPSHPGLWPLEFFACPNPDCASFNVFGAGNLSVAERMGKGKAIRRLYCNVCHNRFSERQGSLLEYTKLPTATVVRIIKCLGHGCSIEATADICEVNARSVQRLLERAGPRAEAFHQQQLDKLQGPLEAVEMDELHGRVFGRDEKKGQGSRTRSVLRAVARRVAPGFTRRWRSRVDS